MRAYRVADRRRTIFDATGAFLHGGRWNSPGNGVIYAAETYSGALLEVLVHANLSAVPKTHGVVTISIPRDMRIDVLESHHLSGWDEEDMTVSRRFGDTWLNDRRTAILLVPSVVLQGRERNVLINPHHPDFSRIQAGSPEPVVWDPRLFPLSKSSTL